MKNRRITFKQVMDDEKHQMDQNIMLRGRTASRLAKHAGGAARRRLYGVKNRALAQLLTKGRAKVGVDMKRFPGLLSIRVRGQGSLHSHEGWLEPYIERGSWGALKEGKNDVQSKP